MSQKSLILDGFWYCLCPSFNPSILARPGFAFTSRKRPLKRHNLPISPTGRISIPPRRWHYNAPGPGRGRQIELDPIHNTELGYLSLEEQDAFGLTNQEDQPEDGNPAQSPKIGQSPTRTMLLKKKVPEPLNVLRKKPESYLEAKLQEIATKTPDMTRVMKILRVLIGERHVRPDVRHYRALILANCDSKCGSAAQVRSLLAEMEPNGIPIDSGTLHAALQALAVHPDYLLREHVMQTLRDRWLSLSPLGWHYVVAGLVRQHQFELALDHVSQMETKNIPVQGWLHSILVYNLCELEEFDEVLQLMTTRTNQGFDITLDLWYYVLDVTSEALHHEATKYVWSRMVELGYLRPPYGVCRNVLTVAARTGDTALAASVFKYLDDVGVPRGLEDYEKMAEAHLMFRQLPSAFEVLCDAYKAGIELEGSSTRSILTYMIKKKTPPRTAWDMLKELKSKKYDIPVACANVVIELCENQALYDGSVTKVGVSFYKELYSLCSKGPDVSTFNALIRMCRRADKREETMFIVKEMSSLNVLPNDQTFEHIILACLDGSNFRSAYLYFQSLLERGGTVSESVAVQIRGLCSNSSDHYALQLRYHPLIRSNPISLEFNEEEDDGKEKEKERGKHRKKGRKNGQETEPLVKMPKDWPGPRAPPSPIQQRLANNWVVRRLRKTREETIARNKERRKRKRRRLAIERNQKEEGWMDHEAGGLIPEEEVRSVKESTDSGSGSGDSHEKSD